MHTDSEQLGIFDKTYNLGLNAVNGSFDGTWWRGNFLYSESSAAGSKVVNLYKRDSRNVVNLKLIVEFDINGGHHYDTHTISNFSGEINLVLNANGGSWDGSKWVGDFLRAQ